MQLGSVITLAVITNVAALLLSLAGLIEHQAARMFFRGQIDLGAAKRVLRMARALERTSLRLIRRQWATRR